MLLSAQVNFTQISRLESQRKGAVLHLPWAALVWTGAQVRVPNSSHLWPGRTKLNKYELYDMASSRGHGWAFCSFADSYPDYFLRTFSLDWFPFWPNLHKPLLSVKARCGSAEAQWSLVALLDLLGVVCITFYVLFRFGVLVLIFVWIILWSVDPWRGFLQPPKRYKTIKKKLLILEFSFFFFPQKDYFGEKTTRFMLCVGGRLVLGL